MAPPNTGTNHGEEIVWIAVMGMTGSGKSTFINLVSGSRLATSDSMESVTKEVEAAPAFKLDGRTVRLIDTPGFDDDELTEKEVLERIASYLAVQYGDPSRTMLHGVIFIHRIDIDRVGNSAKRNLYMFLKLIGPKPYKNIVFVTNWWSKANPVKAAQRVAQLATNDKYWKPALDGGANVVHHTDSIESAQSIIRLILNNHPISLNIQEELVDQKLDISETAAGQEVDKRLAEMAKKYEDNLRKVREDMDDALRRRDEEAKEALNEARKEFQAGLEQAKRDRESMSNDFARQKAQVEQALAAERARNAAPAPPPSQGDMFLQSYHDGRTCRITNFQNGYALQYAGGSASVGPFNGGSHQEWICHLQAQWSTWTFQSKSSGLYLGIDGYISEGTGVGVVSYPFQWTVNVVDGKSLVFPTQHQSQNGIPLVISMWPASGSWYLTVYRDGVTDPGGFLHQSWKFTIV
ncbi:hypothetical protein PILCRDRAFT_828793 [Piloderma croceum F 1598]|uniref:G domain-containing protein n=1 Tax=Piloderma croceum (strain F 1598) TaxID=765440 RepID=A0A0C3F0R8_PILCF|nr:hypothetical protein PILCRDRAFT_828793 [Piloderma croceum F 1598]